MTVKEAIEVLGIDGDISNLTESTLKTRYRELLNLYHPDLIYVNNSPLSKDELEAITKELNEAYDELHKIIQSDKKKKRKEDFDNYANNLIIELQNKYHSYLSNSIIGKDIQKIIDTVILYREILSEDYVEFDKKYQQATELIEQSIKKTKAPSIEYITTKVEELRKRYLGEDRNKKENIDINNMLNGLLLNKSSIISVLEFDENVYAVTSKIEKTLTNYYNREFSKLEQDYKLAFLKFPNAKIAFLEVKLKNFDIKTTDDTDKALFEAKKAVNEAITKAIVSNLNRKLDKYKNDEHYKFIEAKIKKIIEFISNKKEEIITDNWNYEQAFATKVENTLSSYKRLLANKDKLIKRLGQFSDNPIVNDYLKQLQVTTEYEALEKLINDCERLTNTLEQNFRISQTEEVKNALMVKFSHLEVKTLNKYMKIMQQVIDLLEKYQNGKISLDLDKLKQISFSNYEQDLNIIAEACSVAKKETGSEDYELLSYYFVDAKKARR